MKILSKKIEKEGAEYFIQHLTIVNSILPVKLTEKEIEVLGHFMSLDKSVTEDDRFNPLARKKVKEVLELSSGGLSNYLRLMIDKGYLIKSDITKRITIASFLFPELESQEYKFNLINKK